MIKIERITAEKPTILRNDVRQQVTLGMTVTDAELATIEATDGSIVYSVDELEVKELVFQPKSAPVPPATKPAKPAIVKPTTKVAKPSVEPGSKATQAE
jgi:hypothetical protein